MYLEQRSVIGLYLKWLISLALLVPQTAWAQSPRDSRSARHPAPEAMAAIIPIGNSQDFIAIAPVPESQENKLIRSLVEIAPDTTVIGTSGAMDPGIRGLGNDPQFKNANIVQASRVDDIAAVNQLPRSLKQKLLRKIIEIKKTISVERTGLMLAYVSAAATAGATFVATGNYLSAGGMLGVLVAFNSYQYFFKQQWTKFKRYGHDGLIGLAKFISRMTGREFSPQDTEKMGMYGEFNAAWLANTTVTGIVLAMATDWSQMTMQLPLQALVAGFVANPDVWDYSVRRIGQSLNSVESVVKKFIVFRLAVTAVLDLATNLQLIQSTELILGAITMSGLMWMLAGDKVERDIVNKFTVTQDRSFKTMCATYLTVKRRSGI